MNKIGTDKSQSKMLEEILPLESADMYYSMHPLDDYYVHTPDIGKYSKMHDQIPCWSLVALLGVIPQEIFDGEYIINITEGCDNRWVLTYNHHENRNQSYYGLTASSDSLLDACVEMIIKLNERKML